MCLQTFGLKFAFVRRCVLELPERKVRPEKWNWGIVFNFNF